MEKNRQETDTTNPDIEQDDKKDGVLNWDYQNIPDFYNRVRSALNVGNNISDRIIDYFENAPRAEIAIKNRVPNWQELDDTKKLMFDTCVVYQTCYALCPMVSANNITKMKDPSLEINYSANTKDKPCERFLALVDDLIAAINDEELAPSFFGFEVTPSIMRKCRRVWTYPHILPVCRCEKDKEEELDTNLPPVISDTSFIN